MQPDLPYWINPLDYQANSPEMQRASLLVDALDESTLEPPEGVDPEEWASLVNDSIPKTDKEWGAAHLIYFIKSYLGPHLTNYFSPIHYEMADVITDSKRGKRVLWLLPREHAKTTILTFANTLRAICYRLKRNIVIASDSKNQAKEFLRNIKTELESNEKIIRDFGDLRGRVNPKDGEIRGKWGETHIITSNGVQVILWSPNSQVRGLNYNVTDIVEDEFGRKSKKTYTLRPDMVILDDILNDKYIRNRDTRDALERWFFDAAFNAMDSDKGDLFVHGTVLHSDDLLSRLWRDQDRTRTWVKRRTPACEVDADGNFVNVLWPDRWNATKLAQRRQDIGSLSFSREFLLSPREDQAAMFHHDWFRHYIHHTVSGEAFNSLMQAGYRPLPQDLLLITAIDPNTKDRDKDDYTVVATMGFSPTTRCYYIIDLYRDRPSPETQVREMLRHALRWGKQYREDGNGWVHLGFVVETIAYQNSIMYWLKKFQDEMGVHGRRYRREETGTDKVLRAAIMSPMVEQNRLYFPYGMRYDEVTKQPQMYYPFLWLEDEMNDFPQGDFDDGVDALQRAYSVLVREERRYAMAGHYGPSGVEAFTAMQKSYPLLKRYLDEHGM